MTGQRDRRRVCVLYRGRVQGVGFRYTVAGIAREIPKLSGFVMNLGDGSVRMEAEGDEPCLHDFLRAVEDSPVGHFVHSKNIVWTEPTGAEDGFRIRYETLE